MDMKTKTTQPTVQTTNEQHDVQPGYKRTEVGVIPEDWEVARLGERCVTYSGGTPTTSRPDFYGGDIPWITSGDLNAGRVLKVAGRITPNGLDSSSAKMVRRGDLVLALYGATAGVVAITEIDAAINQAVLAIRSDRCDHEYLFQHLASRKRDITETYTQGGQPNLSGAIIRSLPIALPPLPEQRAIAEALSDVDGLLAALDKLIAKKRAIKQAAMQQLLTGQTRLPGFSGEWETKRLGEVCQITTGRKDVNEGNPIGQFPFFTCSRSYTFSDSYSFDTEAILIAGNGEVGNLHYYKGKFEAYQRTYVLTDFMEDVHYLWQQLISFLADSLGIGKIGSSIPYIKKENLLGFQFYSPRDPSEQRAIAAVLSDMDAEIAALERQRDKTQQIKQGMMQQLLTGRVRLVKPEAAP